MRRLAFTVPAVLLAGITFTGAATAPRPGVDWPQFRGIAAGGVAEGFSLPTSWDTVKGTNVAWKTPVAGLGLSSPVIWGDELFISTSISGQKDAGLKVGLYGNVEPVQDDTEHEWRVYALDKKSGKVKWEKSILKAVPKIKRHTKASHANSTLATDGERLIAFFGSEGLYAFDMKGNQLWKKDLGVLDAGWYVARENQWETGSSPVLHEGVVVVQVDVQENSFLAAFDAKTGAEKWRTPRTDVPTWGTPTIHKVGGRTQVLVNGYRHAGAYDFETGKEIWKLGRNGDIPVPTPVVSDGLVYITNAHGPMSPVYAIKETATGDITPAEGATTSEHVVWSVPKGGGYMCTPLVYRDHTYIVTYQGILSVFDAKTGERKYQQRLLENTASAFTSSPVANDGKVYVASEDGQMIVLKAGPVFERIATNDMGASVLATPAISEGRLFVRTQGMVMAIGAK
ncbi:MAG: PQQ-binding-like beta-propeller repeat protein [Acidobacteriota bacterium]|nr:PQQ-binding-like beta-propeller repeat protein [Acidobacteriota bacterium]MDQ3420198.1 PQQ-binding-like beta-propeller repeat protein [Acidobacteriota bacterium]